MYVAAASVLLLVPFGLFWPVVVAGGYLQWNSAGQDYEAFYRFRIQEARSEVGTTNGALMFLKTFLGF